MTGASRRTFLSQVAALAALAGLNPAIGQAVDRGPVKFGRSTEFSFDRLTDRARTLARKPYRPPVVMFPDIMNRLDYDAFWKIQFRREASLYPAGQYAPVELFHLARNFKEPVNVHLVENGRARQVKYRRSYFSMPKDSPAQALPEGIGFAGFRVMRPDGKPDWISFLGASYFRCDGPFGQYGMSVRGLAINSGLAQPEEFPRFTDFWLGPPEDPEDTLTCWALLDSPSVTGAYRMGLRRQETGGGQLVRTSCRLFMRKAVERIGIAPLTSMYWYAERDRVISADWRPEIHDSDGLALKTGAGERIWRALYNPSVLQTSDFYDNNPGGFGLIQRDRNFENYQDDGAFYNRRPSVWVEPVGNWGRGYVQLLEIPATDETFDNIVAYWTPEQLPGAGDSLDYDYLLHWTDRDPVPPSVATTYATFQGVGGIPGRPVPKGVGKMVVDFQGGPLNALTTESKVEPVVEATNGQIVQPTAARPVAGTDRWRLSFDYTAAGQDPVELRAFLRKGDTALTETWITRATVRS